MDSLADTPAAERPEPTLVRLPDGRWNAYYPASITVIGPTRDEAVAAYYSYKPPLPSKPQDWHPTQRRKNPHTIPFAVPDDEKASPRTHETTLIRGLDGEQFDVGRDEWAPPLNHPDDDYLLTLLGAPPGEVVHCVKIHGAAVPGLLSGRVGPEYRRYRVLLIGCRYNEGEEDEEPDYRTPSLVLRAYIRRASWAGSPLYLESLRANGGQWATSIHGWEEFGDLAPSADTLAKVLQAELLLRRLEPSSGADLADAFTASSRYTKQFEMSAKPGTPTRPNSKWRASGMSLHGLSSAFCRSWLLQCHLRMLFVILDAFCRLLSLLMSPLVARFSSRSARIRATIDVGGHGNATFRTPQRIRTTAAS
jgi:hypothetical protein